MQALTPLAYAQVARARCLATGTTRAGGGPGVAERTEVLTSHALQ